MTDKTPTHYNKYRLHIEIYSETVQLYFDTYEEKEAYRFWAAKKLGFDTSAGLARTSVKRANAKSVDLPIGLAETVGDSKRGVKRVTTKRGNPVGSISSRLGKQCVKRGYGDKRTRAQAIAEVTQLRLAYTESLK
jgi:hypothetical protein